MNKKLLIWLMFFLPACSNLAIHNNDINECRELAYEKNSAHSNVSIEHIYNQCVLNKSQARNKQQKEENVSSFMRFIFDLFWPTKDS